MKKLVWISIFIFLITLSSASSPGQVDITENPSHNDYVRYYFNGSVNASDLGRNISSEGLNVSLDDVKEEENITEYKFKLGIGQKTGFLSRSVDLNRLSALNVSRADNFTISYSDRAWVEGPLSEGSKDFIDTEYVINDFEGELTYGLSTFNLISALGVFALVLILPFSIFRFYARKVESDEDLDKTEKVHKLKRVSMSIGFLIALPVFLFFEFGVIFVSTLIASSIYMYSSFTLGFAVLMSALILPSLGSGAFAFLGLYPSLKRLRELEASWESGLKKFFAAMGIVILPVLAWQFVIFQLPSNLTSSLPFMIISLSLFILGVMSLSPYLIIALQDTKLLKGEERKLLESFCNELGVQLRDIKVIEAKGVKQANALFAGTIPKFNYVFMTDYLLENFSEDEIEAILAHEIGHLEKKHIWIKGSAGLVFFSAWMAAVMKTSIITGLMESYGFYSYMGIQMALIFGYIILVQGLLSQKLEYSADKYAKSVKGEETTISALNKLSEANDTKKNTGKLYNLISLHPSIDERIEKLGTS